MSMEGAGEVRDRHRNSSCHTGCTRHCVRQTKDGVSFHLAVLGGSYCYYPAFMDEEKGLRS